VQALVGKEVDRRYRIRAVLGEGGMGAVYEAEHLVLGRSVALKVLHPANAAKPEAVSRFQHEARVVSSIGHPNICELYDVGKLEDGTPFLVMECLGGDTLAERINKEGALDPEVVFETILPILGALAATHRKGIVHRDLKPENIFLARTPGSAEPIPKLLDFGISKVTALDADLHLTRTGMVMGTPYYMAPEQARGERIDHRVDLYAVGVILYECLAGRRPFLAPNYNALLVQILSGEPKPLRSLRPALAEDFEPVLRRAMHKHPGQRFQTAAELQEALVRLRADLSRASRKLEAARQLASAPPPPPAPPPPAPPAPRRPPAPEKKKREPIRPLPRINPDTYVDEGGGLFDIEVTEVAPPPVPVPAAPMDAEFTTPSRPLGEEEAEEIIRAAQRRAQAAPLKQNPLQPPPPLRGPAQAEVRVPIPREEPTAPRPFPAARPAVPAPAPVPPAGGVEPEEFSDNEPTRLYQPGQTRLPPEIERLRKAAPRPPGSKPRGSG
jgi:serine/threonine-protein kinase